MGRARPGGNARVTERASLVADLAPGGRCTPWPGERMRRVGLHVQMMEHLTLDMSFFFPPVRDLVGRASILKDVPPSAAGAIILYAIVPVIQLTNLGIRLVDQSVIEAANAYGMDSRQRLIGVEIPLALPNIMAGVNQTIMMSLAMVVIASLVSAPGLGTLVLDGINNLRLGVGFVAGFAIVLLAILLDRVSKAALDRINAAQAEMK